MSNKIKICKICGDKSIGFHFNAITCESCKSFFRRNSQKKSDHFRCYLGNNCIINIETRNSCKKCRLDKCFSVGMSTDFFHTEEQKRMRKVRNKNTETMSPKSDGISEDSMVSTSSLSSEADAIIAEIFNEESHVSDNESMGYASDTTAYKCELSVVPIVRPIGDCIPNFNELEVQKLRELLNAINSMIAPTADTDTPIVLTNEWDAKNAMIMKNDLQIANIVKMSKCLTTFNALCENDRIVLITYGSMEIGVLRGILNFNYHDNCFTIVSNNRKYILKLDMFDDYPDRSQFDIQKDNVMLDFIRDIGLDYDSDPMIINLLTSIILYNPTRPNLIHKHTIKHQQNIYIYLLQRYLQIKYRSDLLMNAKLLRFKTNLKQLNEIGEMIINISNPMDLNKSPLFKEICERHHRFKQLEN